MSYDSSNLTTPDIKVQPTERDALNPLANTSFGNCSTHPMHMRKSELLLPFDIFDCELSWCSGWGCGHRTWTASTSRSSAGCP